MLCLKWPAGTIFRLRRDKMELPLGYMYSRGIWWLLGIRLVRLPVLAGNSVSVSWPEQEWP